MYTKYWSGLEQAGQWADCSGDCGCLCYVVEYGYPTNPYSDDTDGDGFDDKL